MSHRTENRTYSPSAESVGLRFAEALLGEQNDQSLAAMRRVPAGRVLEAAESSPLFNTFEFLSTVDGEVLPADVGTIFAAGEQADIPVLVGSNADEGTAGFTTFVGAMLPEVKGEIETRYPAATDAQAMQSWVDLFTDLTFTYPQRAWARSTEPLPSDAHLYWFTWAPPIPGTEIYGSFHGAFEMSSAISRPTTPFLPRPTGVWRVWWPKPGSGLREPTIPRTDNCPSGRRIPWRTKLTWSSGRPSVPARTCAYRSLS